MSASTNQHLPLVPDAELLPHIWEYWGHGMGDLEIAISIKQDVDVTGRGWGLGAKTVFRRRQKMGLMSVWQQHHMMDSIGPHIEEVRDTIHKPGVKHTCNWLRQQGILAPRQV
ncbi:hypothetical protein DACRYDRAFT_111605 [Dacryopinax primogenitus]|uniref:Uncharacterized protein n=1 Tax=Dacryopinax primogenitus (strain DJM 731) TaxID=1858805 RepID=M5FW19_DACPD|nr:uncharacterized protein DACRYDRAFT_111605 [Dacryopinax primogenitus]EJT97561.1 hypothetical protein DACRYDRAFT_111605 [Dacryopinax primogenitus]